MAFGRREVGGGEGEVGCFGGGDDKSCLATEPPIVLLCPESIISKLPNLVVGNSDGIRTTPQKRQLQLGYIQDRMFHEIND